jgi:hypothetical protein
MTNSASIHPLWRLLRPEPSLADRDHATDVPAGPPVAPTDKTGISARMLLYDTQANLERFSNRADTLLKSVDDVKKETSTIQALFKQDREILVDEVVNLGDYFWTVFLRDVDGHFPAHICGHHIRMH